MAVVDRVGIFIDGGYLDKVLSNGFGGAKVDLGTFAATLAGSTEILRTHYYHCLPYQGNPPAPEERARFASAQRYLSALGRLPRFEIRLGRLAKISGQFTQKRVDTLLAIDMVRLASKQQISRAILVSGDSDFAPPVLAAKAEGVLVTLFYAPPVHNELLEACDERKLIDQALVTACRRQ